MKTKKQRVLATLYPFLMRFTKMLGTHSQVHVNTTRARPSKPIYNFPVVLNNNNVLVLGEWKDRKILFVNTASDCGYTEQYKELQQLHEDFGHLVRIIAFPANDFGKQEKGSDAEIIRFCQDNFGVEFPLAKKSSVTKSAQQNPIYRWLSSKEENGWNDVAPKWNFCKYLVNEQGILTHYFDPSVSPLSRTVLSAIQ